MKRIILFLLAVSIAIMVVPVKVFNTIINATEYYFQGSGTSDDPFLISSKSDLQNFANLINSPSGSEDIYKKASYTQTCDIDLENISWKPIGSHWNGNDWDSTESEFRIFIGDYNGNGYSITGLCVTEGHMYAGLFGRIGGKGASASIRNLHIEGTVAPTFSLENSTIAGGICGEMSDGSRIQNCSYKGTVSGDNADGIVGGIVGKIYCSGNVENCYFNGSIRNNTSAVHSAGGIVGKASITGGENYISNCYATGMLSSSDLSYSSGICGQLDKMESSLKLNRCFYNLNVDIPAIKGIDPTESNNVTSVSDDELKSEGIISLGLGDAFVMDSSKMNDGYPIGINQIYHLKGYGSKSNPYLISSKEDLMFLADAVNSGICKKCYYKQTNDIDLENENFTTIGTYTEYNYWPIVQGLFSHYDGNYCTIKNLNITESYKGYVGVFGWLYTDASVKNLTVMGNINVPNNFNVGGIVGELGGEQNIENCAFIGNIIGKDRVGGIVGSSWQGGTVNKCYSNATINGNSEVGGICGIYASNVDSTLILSNCYSTGKINASTNSGGIIGKICDSNLVFDNNYYLNSMCSGAVQGNSNQNCIKLSEVALKACADMLGSPFVDNTSSELNDGYPVFEWELPIETFEGSGTLKSPYLIKSKNDLVQFAMLLSSPYYADDFRFAYYKQMSNINLENMDWKPIGGGYENSFEGVYDGNKHSIYGLNVNSDEIYAGLFRTIKNEGMIKNLVVHGNVNSSANYCGGIVGEIGYGGSISNCAFIGLVKGNENIGGISGKIWNSGAILDCYCYGDITGNKYVGGITGMIQCVNENGAGILRNSYFAGKVYGEISAALVGWSEYGEENGNVIHIKNSYYLKTTNACGINGKATIDDNCAIPTNLFKGLATDLGDSYINNLNPFFINNYPCFTWQAYGDINLDNKIAISDAVVMQKYLLTESTITLEQYEKGDINQDGRVDAFDLCTLKKILCNT